MKIKIEMKDGDHCQIEVNNKFGVIDNEKYHSLFHDEVVRYRRELIKLVEDYLEEDKYKWAHIFINREEN